MFEHVYIMDSTVVNVKASDGLEQVPFLDSLHYMIIAMNLQDFFLVKTRYWSHLFRTAPSAHELSSLCALTKRLNNDGLGPCPRIKNSRGVHLKQSRTQMVKAQPPWKLDMFNLLAKASKYWSERFCSTNHSYGLHPKSGSQIRCKRPPDWHCRHPWRHRKLRIKLRLISQSADTCASWIHNDAAYTWDIFL